MTKKKTLIIILFLVTLLFSNLNWGRISKQVNPAEEPLCRVRIETANPQALSAELVKDYYDVIGSVKPFTLDVIVSVKEMKGLQNRGLKVNVIRKGRPLGERRRNRSETSILPGGYPSLDEIIAKMNASAAAYPAIAKVFDLTETYNTPTTFEGRHEYIIKISDNVTEEEDEPKVMIVSNHHAREVVTPVIALYAIEQFTSLYGSDPRITAAVDSCEIWIAPTWNPDGYNHVYTVDDYWRKNRRVFTSGIGVDLNRNYPQQWDGPHSGSTSVSSNIYKGPSPASEAETQAMIALALDQNFTRLIDYHSSGREALWGYYEPLHPFDDWLQQEAVELANNSGYSGAGNARRPSADGENYQWHLAKTGTYSFLVETHTQFAPTYESALAEAIIVFPGILWDIERAIPLSGHVTDDSTGTAVNANIELIDVNFQTGETNSSRGHFGRYHIYFPSGLYLIRFSADGYSSVEKSVSINADTSQILDVQLSRKTSAVSDQIATSRDATSPEKIILKGNYPNPFNAKTAFSYKLKETGNVQLEVYDLMGHKIKTLAYGKQNKGSYKITWDATNELGHRVSSSVYLYRITLITHNKVYTQVRKMMLLK